MLTEKDLRSLVSLLDDVSSQWESIATALGLSGNHIAGIRQEHSRTADRFRETLKLWLNGLGLKPTRKNLATALQSPPVSKRDLARKVSPTGIPSDRNLLSVPHQFPFICTILTFALGVTSLIVFSLLFCYGNYRCDPRGSFSLPNKEGSFVGREREMKVIKQYLEGHDSEARVVTLFGLAGLGKSTIAIHVGHEMLQQGWDVYYIRVEDAANVDGLEKKLMDISDLTFTGERLMKWARELQRSSLLILDNVDHHWVEKDLNQHFKINFVEKLLQYSSAHLKVLITSQQKITFYTFVEYHELHSLTLKDCVQLTSVMAPGSSELESYKICTLVGNMPVAIKVLTSLIKSDGYSMNDVIQELKNVEKKFSFIKDAGDNVKDRIVGPIKVAFDSLKPDYQICSLLLARFGAAAYMLLVNGTFTTHILFKTMEDLGYKGFDVTKYFRDLTSKSLLEEYSLFSLRDLTSKSLLEEHSVSPLKSYRFHVLIRDFLRTSFARNEHNMTTLIIYWWKNVLESNIGHLKSVWDVSDLYYNYSINTEDVDALVQVLDQDLYSAKSTAIKIFAHAFFRNMEKYELGDYINKFQNFYESEVKRLQFKEKSDSEVMYISTIFHVVASRRFLESENHAPTFANALIHGFVAAREACFGQCIDLNKVEFPGCRYDGVTNKILMLHFYDMIEKDKALHCLGLQAASKGNSYTVYVALHDITNPLGFSGLCHKKDFVSLSLQVAMPFSIIMEPYYLTSINRVLLPSWDAFSSVIVKFTWTLDQQMKFDGLHEMR